ncbi:MAG: 2-oxoacid:acceptor oxidoreductase subunit alpha [Planctomycetota bacterium]
MSRRRDFCWMIGGAQGSGINLAAETFGKACLRAGLHVFSNIEYHSNIKGEHSYYRLRIGDRPTRSHLDRVDVLVALDKETVVGNPNKVPQTHSGHLHEVAEDGVIVYNRQDPFLKEGDFVGGRARPIAIPFLDIIAKALEPLGKSGDAARYTIMFNVVGFGATVGLTGFPLDVAEAVVREGFTGRKAHLADLNVAALKAAALAASDAFPGFPHRLARGTQPKGRIYVRGIQAVGIGKLKAGCGFQTYYPITPATDESEYLEKHQEEFPISVVQCEDEISAFLMACGAAHGGVRAATSTSGPGFSLMCEGMSWAAMTESPGPVIFLYQRAGPATGLPTRNEQGDLRFVLHAAHGEFPRIVTAPGDVQETFEDAFFAFNYADRYQCPVVVLLDKYLASSYLTAPAFRQDGMAVDRGARFSGNGRDGGYRRYRFTDSGISPRSHPGQEGGIFWTSGDEHDEQGHIQEQGLNRTRMMKKRMGKLSLAEREIPAERAAVRHGPAQADVTILGWGSTKGIVLDAMEALREEGVTANFVQVRLMSPFPTARVVQLLEGAKQTVALEMNYSAQLSRLVQEFAAVEIGKRVVKYDGRPFSQDEAVEGIRKAMAGGRGVKVEITNASA